MLFAEYNGVSCSVGILWRASCDHSDPDFFCSIKRAAGKANFFFIFYFFAKHSDGSKREGKKKLISQKKKSMTSNCAPSAHDIMHFIKRRRRRAQGKRHRTEITRTLNLNTHLHFSSFAPALCHFCGAHDAGLCLGFRDFTLFSLPFLFVTPLISLEKDSNVFLNKDQKKPQKTLRRPFFFFPLYRCQTF